MKIFPFPEVIFSSSSVLSGDVKVISDGKSKSLIVGGLVQSVSWDYPGVGNKVWGKLLDFPWPVKPNPNVLILGLGGATTVHLASKKYKPRVLTVVEIDKLIINLAYEQFDLASVPNLKVAHSDAIEYINGEQHDLFDVAVVDIYLGSHFPGGANGQEFYANLKKHLSPGAIFSVNRIFFDHEKEKRRKFMGILASNFGEVVEAKLAGTTSMKNYLYYSRV